MLFWKKRNEESFWSKARSFKGYCILLLVDQDVHPHRSYLRKFHTSLLRVSEKYLMARTKSTASLDERIREAEKKVTEAYENSIGAIIVNRPKALGDLRGVSYIYPILYRFGLIEVQEKVKEILQKGQLHA